MPKRLDSLTPSALEYSRKHEMHALVCALNGRVIDEAYGEGYDGSTPHALYSGAKSFWGIAGICAERDGILRLDDRVADTFAGWAAHPWKRRVTLRHLLQLTSGIGFGGLGSAVPTFEKALEVDLKNEPGTTFTYGGIPLQIFGAVLARKLDSRKQTPHDYLLSRVLDPIGMRIAKWRTLTDGSQPLPTGAFVSAYDWLKYGAFVCDHHEEFAECFQGSAINPRYGLGFWLGAPQAPLDLAYASGAAGQAMYIVPSLRLVVVRFGKSASYKHEPFLKRLLSP